MSKLMSVLGIILLAVGLAIGLLEIANPGHLQGMGVNLDTSVSLIVGGVLAIGLGGVIAALERGTLTVPGYEETTTEAEVAVTEEVETSSGEAAEKPSRKILFPSFGRRAAATAAAAGEAAAEDAPPSVQQTIDALEQAKQDIKGALGGMETILPETNAAESKSDSASDEPAEGELYVIEEKTIRGRPARILSDNTVEAETDEGWMRFENIDHLNEYLDAAHG
jgi:hypothetical protein